MNDDVLDEGADEPGSEVNMEEVESCDRGERRGGMAMCMSVRCIVSSPVRFLKEVLSYGLRLGMEACKLCQSIRGDACFPRLLISIEQKYLVGPCQTQPPLLIIRSTEIALHSKDATI
jgi:hypothetical protein